MWPIWVRDAATGRVPAARANVPDGERRDGSPEPEPADHAVASPAVIAGSVNEDRLRRAIQPMKPAPSVASVQVAPKRLRIRGKEACFPGPHSGTATIAEPYGPKHQEHGEQLACQSPIPLANQQCGYNKSTA